MLIDWSRTDITYVGIRNLITYEGIATGAGAGPEATGAGFVYVMRRRRRHQRGSILLTKSMGWRALTRLLKVLPCPHPSP